MKALLVTSQITYVPENYQALFEEALSGARPHLAGLVLLQNVSLGLSKDLIGLTAMGCRGIAGHLALNLIRLPLKSRERLFERAGLPVLKCKSMNDPWIIDWVRDQKIDLVINVRTRCIYKKAILETPRLGCINIHHGLLPEYRGTLCDLYALSEGRRAGFTIHQMNEKIDAGRILLRREVSNPGEKNYARYLAQTSKIEGQELARLLNETAQRDALPAGTENRATSPTYTRNPSPSQISRMRKEGMLL